MIAKIERNKEEKELIEKLKEARKLLDKDTGKSVEDSMFYYHRVLLKAYEKKLRIDPLETPGGLISDLQNIEPPYMGNFGMLTGAGIEYVEKVLRPVNIRS